MTSKTPILKVKANASKEEIKKAYYKAALEHHPDKGGDPEKFKQLGKEYEQLNLEHDELLLKVDSPAAPADRYTTGVKSSPSSFLAPKTTVKEENVTQYYTETNLKVRFSPGTSNEERLAAIFNGMHNRFGFAANAKIDDEKDLQVGSRSIGRVTFLGSFLKKFETTVSRVVERDKPQEPQIEQPRTNCITSR